MLQKIALFVLVVSTVRFHLIVYGIQGPGSCLLRLELVVVVEMHRIHWSVQNAEKKEKKRKKWAKMRKNGERKVSGKSVNEMKIEGQKEN